MRSGDLQDRARKAWWVVAGALIAVATLLGVLYYQALRTVINQGAQITSLNASTRAAWQKVYDAQEAQEDKDDAEKRDMYLKNYELEKQLTECRGPQK